MKSNAPCAVSSSKHGGPGSEVATSRGCCKLTLEVLSNNPNAMASYSKFGFTSYELDPALGTAQFWEKKL